MGLGRNKSISERGVLPWYKREREGGSEKYDFTGVCDRITGWEVGFKKPRSILMYMLCISRGILSFCVSSGIIGLINHFSLYFLHYAQFIKQNLKF